MLTPRAAAGRPERDQRDLGGRRQRGRPQGAGVQAPPPHSTVRRCCKATPGDQPGGEASQPFPPRGPGGRRRVDSAQSFLSHGSAVQGLRSEVARGTGRGAVTWTLTRSHSYRLTCSVTLSHTHAHTLVDRPCTPTRQQPSTILSVSRVTVFRCLDPGQVSGPLPHCHLRLNRAA